MVYFTNKRKTRKLNSRGDKQPIDSTLPAFPDCMISQSDDMCQSSFVHAPSRSDVTDSDHLGMIHSLAVTSQTQII